MRFKIINEQYLTEDIESMKKYYPNIENNEFQSLIALDPTYQEGSNNAGKYGKWILGLANKGALKNKGHVRDLLQRFDDNVKQLKNKDIMKYKTLEDVDTMLNDDNSYVELSHRQEVRQRQKDRKHADLGTDAELVFEDDEWEVWIPKTYSASCNLGQGTSWCTASTESDYYYNKYKYEYGGEYYITINKANPEEKYQFHFESDQYMNKNDKEIDLNYFLKEHVDLYKFYSPIVINSFLDQIGLDKDSEQQIVDVDKENIVSRITQNNNRDSLSFDFIMSCFNDEVYDRFFDNLDYIDNSSIEYAIDNISEQNKNKIKQLGCDIDNIEFGDIKEEFSDIYQALQTATYDSIIDGSVNDCMDDFNKSFKNSIPKFIDNYNFVSDNKTIQFTVNVDYIKNNIFSIKEEAADNEIDDIKDLISCYISNKFNFYEPPYGWNGFAEDSFNEILSNELPE